MKITKRQLRRIIKEELMVETAPTFNLRSGDSVRHKGEPELGLGRVVAKGSKRDRVVLVKWEAGFTRRHDPSSLIKEEMSRFKPRKKRAYHQISDSMMAKANAVKRKFLKLHDAEVKINGQEGWIMVNGKKAVNISSASGRPVSMEDMLLQMEDAL